MYGFKQSFPFQAFVGATLIQVCFGENDLQMVFAEQIRASISSKVTFDDDEEVVDFIDAAPRFKRILGQCVLSARVRDLNTLELRFSGGNICIVDDSTQFESASFSIRGEVFVV